MNEALHTLSDEEFNAQRHMRHVPYNETATRAKHIIHILRHVFEREPPQIQRPLIIPQTLPPPQPIAVALMRRPVPPGGLNLFNLHAQTKDVLIKN